MRWPSQTQQHLNNSMYLCTYKFAKVLLYTLSHLGVTITPILQKKKLRLEKINFHIVQSSNLCLLHPAT